MPAFAIGRQDEVPENPVERKAVPDPAIAPSLGPDEARPASGPNWIDSAERVLEARFGSVRDIEPFVTWGRTVVVAASAGAERRPVVLKATAERDVLVEAVTLRMVAEAGVPVPRLFGVGEQPELPGGRWIAMERAHGVRLADVPERDLDVALQSLAVGLSRLHGIAPAGFGWLNRSGSGRFGSWSTWLRGVLARDLQTLLARRAIRPETADALGACFAGNTAGLDRRPARLVHGDLGDTEVFVDEDHQVTAVVDWADAVVGDPLYDFARFVAGGPAADPRPERMRPVVERAYALPQHFAGAGRFYSLYQAHNAIRNAAWSVVHAPEWADDLVAFATAEASRVGTPG